MPVQINRSEATRLPERSEYSTITSDASLSPSSRFRQSLPLRAKDPFSNSRAHTRTHSTGARVTAPQRAANLLQPHSESTLCHKHTAACHQRGRYIERDSDRGREKGRGNP